MPLLRRRRILAAKLETVPGTAESLTAADATINVFDPTINPTIEFEERPGQGSFSHLTGTLGAYGATLTFTTELHGGSTTPVWASTLLPACGWVENTGIFSPKSRAPGVDGVKTATLALYEDGRLKVMRGAMGTFVVTFPSGRKPTIEWTFTGIWMPVTDVALVAPTYVTTPPLRFGDAALTIGAYTPKVEQVTLDAGNEVILREDATDASGYSTAIITARRPIGTLNPEAEKVGTKDVYGEWLSRTEQALAIELGGEDNYLAIEAPKLQFTNVQDGDRNNLITDELEFQLNRDSSAGDDELIFDFNYPAE